MAEVDFMSAVHKSTQRNYLARVNDPEFPKAKAAVLAKKFDFDYWDDDRRRSQFAQTTSAKSRAN